MNASAMIDVLNNEATPHTVWYGRSPMGGQMIVEITVNNLTVWVKPK